MSVPPLTDTICIFELPKALCVHRNNVGVKGAPVLEMVRRAWNGPSSTRFGNISSSDQMNGNHTHALDLREEAWTGSKKDTL